MQIIAQGLRQVKPGPNGTKIVKFDQGMYTVSEKAKIHHEGGEDWVWCDAHADEETGEGWAVIGGIKEKLSYNPFDDKGNPTSKDDDEH